MSEENSTYDIEYNLFSYGYKELTQDAFICWLIKWAYYDGEGHKELKECGQDFVKALFDKHEKKAPLNLDPKKVKIWQQYKRIDVLARIGDYVLLIEDKTGTGDHSEQLERYYDAVSDEGNVIPIYLKTGNQSLFDKLRIEKSTKYKVFEREDFLDVIKPYYEAHPIISDFYNHLMRKKEATNSYKEWSENGNEEVHWLSCEGAFRELENHLVLSNGDNSLCGFCNDQGNEYPSVKDGWQKRWEQKHAAAWGWHYVPNQTGGFMGFWWYFRTIKCGTAEAFLYLQLEAKKPYDLSSGKLCFKLAMEDKEGIKWRCLEYISEGREDLVEKPSRMGSGYTVTFAVWKNRWIEFSPNGGLDISATKKNLIKAQCILDDVVEKLESHEFSP